MDTYKIVCLRHDHDDIVIPVSTYELVACIVQANRICRTCGEKYSEENPRVEKNGCLVCFIKDHKEQHHRPFILELLGTEKELDDNGDATYLFLDREDGQVYTHHSNNERDSLRMHTFYTARHYGFPVPETWEVDGHESILYKESGWTMWGQFRRWNVIGIEYHPSYGKNQPRSLSLLLYKDGRVVDLSHRTKDVQAMFTRAKAWLETVRNERGEYRMDWVSDGFTIDRPRTSHMLHIIARDEHQRTLQPELIPEHLPWKGRKAS